MMTLGKPIGWSTVGRAHTPAPADRAQVMKAGHERLAAEKPACHRQAF